MPVCEQTYNQPTKGLFRNGVGSQNGGLAMRGANYDNAHCIIGRGSPLYNPFLQIYFLIQRQPAWGLNTNISTELTKQEHHAYGLMIISEHISHSENNFDKGRNCMARGKVGLGRSIQQIFSGFAPPSSDELICPCAS